MKKLVMEHKEELGGVIAFTALSGSAIVSLMNPVAGFIGIVLTIICAAVFGAD